MKLRHILKLWPGLEYLALHGSFRAWLTAMFYAVFASAVICTVLLWENLLSPNSQTLLLILFAFAWVLGLIVSHRFEKAFQESVREHQKAAVAQDILPLAQTEFLRSNFFEAERLLRERLTKFPEDVPTRFFLISVLKKQLRRDEALEQLAILENTETLGLWRLDLQREKAAILHED